MRLLQVPFLVAVAFLMGLFIANAEDDKKSAKPELPAKSEKWEIVLNGRTGPPERYLFRVKVSNDGAVEVQEIQTDRKALKAPTKGKVTPEETQKLFDLACKIVKTYDEKTSDGGTQDGWNYRLSVKGDSSFVSVWYRGQRVIQDISPEFKDIQQIINKRLPQVSFPD